MPIEIVYYNTERNEQLEQRLGEFGTVAASSGEDKRSFLIALSEAVGRSDIIITVGAVDKLAATLSKGLSLPLVPIDWSAIGIAGEEGAALPQGALPLLVDGSVYGMIIESASQCIIAVDDDRTAVEHLTETYISAYLSALSGSDGTSPDSDQPSQETATEQAVETPEESAPEQYEDSEDYGVPHIQPVEYFSEEQPNEPDAPDIFADIEDDDFLIIESKKSRHGWLIALICILVALAIGVGGGYFGYNYWWVPKQYDDSVSSARELYDSSEVKIGTIPAEYALQFGALYFENSDIIGWINSKTLGIDLPIVSAAGKQNGYYQTHLFDGAVNKYGTPHIKYPYDTVSNINPNLVVYGNNYGGGRAFANVEKLLDTATARDADITTDSVFYGSDSWRIFSVMVLDEIGGDYDYTDNYGSLTSDQRRVNLKGALNRSRVDLGMTESDMDAVGLDDTFLTLVTPYSAEQGKVVVVMAIRKKSDTLNSAPSVGLPEGDIPSEETASDEASDTANESNPTVPQ